jgi:hypothetical protein
LEQADRDRQAAQDAQQAAETACAQTESARRAADAHQVALDICPIANRSRLSYPRAEYLFKIANVPSTVPQRADLPVRGEAFLHTGGRAAAGRSFSPFWLACW